MDLYRSVFAISFGSLKTVSKMLHIILSLFNELIVNGFCLPPEPNDQKENSQLKNIENSGFGQGDTSGAKDVSERLDCQDQLDELAHDDDQQAAEDETSNEIGGEENGDEMDDDFQANEVGPENADNEERSE